MQRKMRRSKIKVGQLEITKLMIHLNPTVLTMMTLNANGLNISTKKLRKKRHHPKSSKNRAAMTLFISAKVAFSTRTITRDKERYYIMIKGSFLCRQES